MAAESALSMPGDSPAMAVARRHLIGMWQNGDFTLADTLFTDDFRDHNPVAGQAPGKAGLIDAARAIRLAFPDQRYEVLKLLQTGDLVIDHWILRGTHTGPLFGHPPTGRRVEFRGSDILRIVDGRISDIWHVEELMQMYAQLGIAPN